MRGLSDNEVSDKLVILDLSHNGLSGMFPQSVSEMLGFVLLDPSYNLFVGGIPLEIIELKGLQGLFLSNNMLTGEIPLNNNNLSGAIQPEFDALDSLKVLDICNNMFSGKIPLTLAGCKSLEVVDMSFNNPSGEQIQYIDLSGNNFSGFIPQENKDFGFNYKLLSSIGIDLSENSLHGEIPDGLSRLQGLEYLNLSHNYGMGQIPKSLKSFWSLKTLDLSYNSLTGCRFSVASRVMFGGDRKMMEKVWFLVGHFG
ncbi:hypothetical protein GIB67_008780 [Kingdonia uniflora]|uniref:Uncharacterized protein n=1 Tax=Kingdonia uniflora TaxID=39325 RepID=A0A7J7P5K0_9MAGN|nr:hypothetical protein GIB67_008780 [Kingdonia uniflora]